MIRSSRSSILRLCIRTPELRRSALDRRRLILAVQRHAAAAAADGHGIPTPSPIFPNDSRKSSIIISSAVVILESIRIASSSSIAPTTTTSNRHKDRIPHLPVGRM